MSGLCGIVDFTGAPIDAQVLLGMAAAASQPLDSTRSLPWNVRGVALSHQAPASHSQRGESACLIADVRLDNRAELIQHLSARHMLTAQSPADADLILAAYQAWGTSCPKYLLGDFAFAVWDSVERHLFCARDPLGIKPFHYTRIGPLFCFASEAQQILQHPSVPLRLDEQTIAAYLIDTWDDPAHSFFQGIRRLPPAHSMVSDSEQDRIERYWDVDPEKLIVYRDDHEYTSHFLEIFQHAVDDRLKTSDRPAGILMSGGLDSTSVAALARRSIPRDHPRGLFSCSFVFSSLKECDERSYIEITAKALGLEAELVDAEGFGFLESLHPRVETPFLAWEQATAHMMGRIRARGAGILLTGHGGDELITGSHLVYADRLRRGDLRVLGQTLPYMMAQGRSAWRVLYRYFGHLLIPGAMDRKIRQILGKPVGPVIPEWIQPDFIRRNGLTDRASYSPQAHPRGRAWRELYDALVDLRGWDSTIQWYDQVSSPFGIEVRHPFLDRRLVEFMLAIPSKQRAKPGLQKPFLRRAMEGLLPEQVRQRTGKTSLRPFFDFSLRCKERERIQELMTHSLAADIGILSSSKLQNIYAEWLSDEGEQGLGVWQFATLEIWLRALLRSAHQ